jgi:hypothetical protein
LFKKKKKGESMKKVYALLLFQTDYYQSETLLAIGDKEALIPIAAEKELPIFFGDKLPDSLPAICLVIEEFEYQKKEGE